MAPTAAVFGGENSSEATESIRKIDPILGNKDREDFAGHIDHSQIVDSKFCITSSHPAMTVSTGFYLVSSVVYVEEMRKHVVIFQAIIKHQTAEQFAFYFEAVPKKFAIQQKFFLGMIMDFSLAERQGFQKARQKYFGMNEDESLGHNKCCYFSLDAVSPTDLRRHESRTSNGIESYHRNLYTFTTKGSHLSQALREIIKRTTTSKKLVNSFYEVSHSRAPDTLIAIYGMQASIFKKRKDVETASAVNQVTNFYDVFGVDKDSKIKDKHDNEMEKKNIASFLADYDITDTGEYIQVDETTADLEDMIFTETMEKNQDIMEGEDYVDANDISDNESVKSVESVDSVKLFEELYAECYVSESEDISMRAQSKIRELLNPELEAIVKDRPAMKKTTIIKPVKNNSC
ncbi:hypothetical protein INT47_004162 [Mucor saturninus]|uniref:Uncharacterized protein n=1 Tax=Mucor saturninus TaxID=64648 RepID=A0A8H7UX68_9FUNG|nr:hypothetical protein INT47_004162 [Mucor saturninus]